MLKQIRRALTSMRLAVILIGYLVACCVLATLVPQGLEPAAYHERFGRPIAGLIVASGFSNYFASPLFIAPVALFMINLAACSLGRFLRVIRGSAPRRHGPDILHAGLLLFAIGASLTAVERQSGIAHLAVGDQVELPGGRRATLLAFSTERYEDGRPKEWTSLISVARGGETIVAAYPLRVNHPLALGDVKLYQASREVVDGVELSGIMAVRDSFFGLVLASLAIIALGLALTFIQKLGDLSR